MSLIGHRSRIGGGAALMAVVLCYMLFGPRFLVALTNPSQASGGASEKLTSFAGSWQWMFKDKPFVTMVLVPTGDHFAGYMTNGYFNTDDSGNMTDAGSHPGTSPIVRSFFAGTVLHIVVQYSEDKSLSEWTMTLIAPDKAQFDTADPERPANMKPWMARRVSSGEPKD